MSIFELHLATHSLFGLGKSLLTWNLSKRLCRSNIAGHVKPARSCKRTEF